MYWGVDGTPVVDRGQVTLVVRQGGLMRWTAYYSDGFTRRLLSYSVTCKNGMAEVEASWFLPMPSTKGFLTRFALSDDRVLQAVPSLRLMDEKYETTWEDLDTKVLVVEVGGEIIRRSVYGGGILIDEKPELQAFLDLFDWLEEEVVKHLPFRESTA